MENARCLIYVVSKHARRHTALLRFTSLCSDVKFYRRPVVRL
jgi:hypothetical protein